MRRKSRSIPHARRRVFFPETTPFDDSRSALAANLSSSSSRNALRSRVERLGGVARSIRVRYAAKPNPAFERLEPLRDVRFLLRLHRAVQRARQQIFPRQVARERRARRRVPKNSRTPRTGSSPGATGTLARGRRRRPDRGSPRTSGWPRAASPRARPPTPTAQPRRLRVQRASAATMKCVVWCVSSAFVSIARPEASVSRDSVVAVFERRRTPRTPRSARDGRIVKRRRLRPRRVAGRRYQSSTHRRCRDRRRIR